jgi:AcrR family transcriptional regulator
MPREYRKSRRAEKEEETRLRIVEAAVELHGEVGGAAATATAIAERAGVGRVTYYRHFPDERTLLQACTGHYLGLNPPPDPRPWTEIGDPDQRTRVALCELYAFYGRTETMLWRAELEVATNPILAEAMQPFGQYLDSVREILLAGRADAGDPVLRAVVGHALAFGSWHSLARDQELSNESVVALMLCLIAEPCSDLPRAD